MPIFAGKEQSETRTQREIFDLHTKWMEKKKGGELSLFPLSISFSGATLIERKSVFDVAVMDTVLDNTTLDCLTCFDSLFFGSKVLGGSISNSSFSHITFESSRFSKIFFCKVVIENCTFSHCEFDNCSFDNVIFNNCTFSLCSFTFPKIHCLKFSSVVAYQTYISLIETNSLPSEVILENSNIPFSKINLQFISDDEDASNRLFIRGSK